MWDDVVKSVQQITVATVDFQLENNNPFYVYLLPLTSESPSSMIVSGKPSYNKDNVNIPLAANQWNPILINRLNVTLDMLNKYAVFIGLNYVP